MDSWDEDSADQSDNDSEKGVLEPPQKANKRKNADNGEVKAKKTKSPVNGVKSSKKSKVGKLQEKDEINNLPLTEGPLNDSLFRLQIDELFKEVSIKNKRKNALESWIQTTLKPHLENVPSIQTTLSKVHKNSKTTSFGFKNKCPLKTDQDFELKLQKPESWERFGCYEIGAHCGPNLETSINVVMPRKYFHVKDFLNNRFFVKQWLYMCYIGENLLCCKKQVVLHNNNLLLSVLQIQPTHDEKVVVKIHFTPPKGYFKPARFLPNQNNLKMDLFGVNLDGDLLRNTPTILYNSALNYNVTLQENWNLIMENLREMGNVVDAIKLLQIWTKQRGLNDGFGSFALELIPHFMVYLGNMKKVNKFMSCYQILRNFWTFISAQELRDLTISNAPTDTLELFKQEFPLVFLDVTGCYNLAAFIDEGFWKKVQLDSGLALKLLDECRIESFQSLFLTKVPFELQFDAIVDMTQSLPLSLPILPIISAKTQGYASLKSITPLTTLLQRGLNNRILNLLPQITITNGTPSKLLYGITLNPDAAFNFMEMGPRLNEFKEAQEFREFWGHLSSDRRFKDSSTHVAVYFKTSTLRGKRAIVKRILKYLLMEKHSLKFELHFDEFEEFLINRKVVAPFTVGTNEEASLKVVSLADELAKTIRTCQMSLSITGVQGVSDAFCYTSPFPPLPAKSSRSTATQIKDNNVIFSDKTLSMIPRYIEPMDLYLQMEHSSKWPADLEALRHLKTSFYIEISKSLLKQGIVSNVTRDYVQVYYEGLVFRYRLYVSKEVHLMRKEMGELGVVRYVGGVDSDILEREGSVRPKLVASLKGLQMQHPSFGPSTALIKRWLRAHLIDEYHLSDMVVNLLNASLYLNASSFKQSCTPQVAFLRFLKFVSEFQWQVQPVLVNFNDILTKEEISDLESQLQTNKALNLHIITPYDDGQSSFTKTGPSQEILNCLQQLATATLTLFLEKVRGLKQFELNTLFTPNLEGYNLLIHLRPLLNPRRHESIENVNDSKIVLEEYKKQSKIPITGFNPVALYLEELRRDYGEFAEFFHNSFGGNTIGVLWSPQAKEKKTFMVGNVAGRRLEGTLVLDEEALIEDFYMVGKRLVKWIERK